MNLLFSQYIHQDEKATSMPTDAVLCGLLLIVSYSMAHSVVQVEGIDWMEPVLVWASICMPTGSGKSTLCKLLRKLVHETRSECGQSEGPFWLSDDQSFEKLRELMNDNSGKLLGLYDELSMFLAQMNVCRGRNVTDSQQVSTFLQLYGSDQWIRRTGMLFGKKNVWPHMYDLFKYCSYAPTSFHHASLHVTVNNKLALSI